MGLKVVIEQLTEGALPPKGSLLLLWIIPTGDLGKYNGSLLPSLVDRRLGEPPQPNAYRPHVYAPVDLEGPASTLGHAKGKGRCAFVADVYALLIRGRLDRYDCRPRKVELGDRLRHCFGLL